MKRCIIIGGADIADYSVIREKLLPEDFFVYCDSGLKHMEALGCTPDLIVGDFDSHENPHLPVETIVLPRAKDDTDTVFAVKEAIRRGYDQFLLIGVIGARLDHTLGNVSILFYLDSLGMSGMILDDYSEMEVVSDDEKYIDNSWPYFSLLNLTGNSGRVTIRNAKFPLTDAEITCEYQYGISNEVLPGMTASVRAAGGRLLLVRVRA